MRVLEALRILEEATLDSKQRDICTSEVREALDVLDPYCLPKWRVEGFRDSLRAHAGNFGPDLEGQQQVLRVYFSGIYDRVRQLLVVRIKKLHYEHIKTKDTAVKSELDRLTAALEKLPEKWNFIAR
jgi:hypothetical protein